MLTESPRVPKFLDYDSMLPFPFHEGVTDVTHRY